MSCAQGLVKLTKQIEMIIIFILSWLQLNSSYHIHEICHFYLRIISFQLPTDKILCILTILHKMFDYDKLLEYIINIALFW